MRTAQNTQLPRPRKERRAAFGRALALGIALALPLGGCRGLGTADPGPDLRLARATGLHAADLAVLRDGGSAARRAALRGLRDGATASDLPVLLALLDDSDTDVAADAAFAMAISDARGAAGRLVAAMGPETRPEVVAAAALGLGSRPGEDAERGLLALARRPERPAVVPGALLSHYRWRGRPAEPVVGDPGLLAYEKHPEAEGRAGLGHYARAVKDPALLAPLMRLAADPEPEVRRAAAIALARSSAAPWPEERAREITAALARLVADPDARVVVAACRALSSLEDASSLAPLRESLGHAAFPVRVAAIEGLARRESKDDGSAVARLATDDPSVSVRGAAATAVAALDPSLAREIAERVLADPAEFVRASACDLLTAGDEEAEGSSARLVDLAESDPHVRVRHTALGALEGREGAEVTAALGRALADDPDPVVVAVACGVAAANGLDQLLPLIREVPERFPGRGGGDARAAAAEALAELGTDKDLALVRRRLRDRDPTVAFAAERALAARAGMAAPSARRSGVANARPADLARVGGRVALLLETSRGPLRIELYPEAAPVHVAHVVAVARRGGYDGLSWHRVVPDFVIQGGCPRGDGSGSAGVTLPLESTRIPFERGVLGMPRSSHPDSGGCQLFVMHSRAPHLDVHYTAFGRVVDGDDVLDEIDVDDRIERVLVVTGGAAAR